MIKERRQQRILECLATDGVVQISALSVLMPEVSRVTLRRDIAELAEAGALKRTHGGAVRPDADLLKNPKDGAKGHPVGPLALSLLGVDGLDAVILPPLQGKGGDALRRHVLRRGIPFLAESAPQPGGVYLGPDNFRAAHELGQLAGKDASFPERKGSAPIRVLIIGQTHLENTQARVAGFEAGLRETLDDDVEVVFVNGQGSYKVAFRLAMDAYALGDPFDVIFAVNDHAAIAGADAAARHDAAVRIYATGGENADFLARVGDGGPIRAIAAFFPEIVGALAVDVVAAALDDGLTPAPIVTPHAVITAQTLASYYEKSDADWSLRADRRAEMLGVTPPVRLRAPRPKIGFMPHFPAHDWYRAMIQAMQARATEKCLELVVTQPHLGISTELTRLRTEIARLAAETLVSGETIILGEGEATLCLAAEIRRIAFSQNGALADLTVITNSLDVLHRLEGAPGLKTLLTSGEYQAVDRCLVGPSVGALFERMRADRAFLSVAGVSDRFGASAVDERLALAGSRLGAAARRTVVLADHTLIGAEANHRIAGIKYIDAVITDDGSLPADRQSLRLAGVEVLVAGDAADSRAQQDFSVVPGRIGRT